MPSWCWRTAFFVAGVTGLLLALVMRASVREPRRGRWDGGLPARAVSAREALALLSSSPRFWWLAAGCALGNVVNYGALTFNPSFLIRSHELPLTQVRLTLAAVWSLSGMLGTYAGGTLADRLGRRDARWYLLVPAAGQLAAIPFSVLTYLSDALAGEFGAHGLRYALLLFSLVSLPAAVTYAVAAIVRPGPGTAA